MRLTYVTENPPTLMVTICWRESIYLPPSLTWLRKMSLRQLARSEITIYLH